MKTRSEKSIELYNVLLQKGYDKHFSEVISTELNTDFTATRMLGYLKHYAKLPEADIVDEMLGILSDRQQWIDKKMSENAQAKYNQYMLEKEDIFFSDF